MSRCARPCLPCCFGCEIRSAPADLSHQQHANTNVTLPLTSVILILALAATKCLDNNISMGFFSILPESLSTIETWLIRIFVRVNRPSMLQETQRAEHQSQLLLAFVTVGPWLLLLVYDIVFYIWRSATYKLGGRARGQQRPRAPSLTERPDGHKRRFSLATMPTTHDGNTNGALTSGAKHRSSASFGRGTYQVAEETE